MSYPYESPHDNPFGPPYPWDRIEHCYENNNVEEYCNGFDQCECVCEKCIEAKEEENSYLDTPEYEYEFDFERDYE